MLSIKQIVVGLCLLLVNGVDSRLEVIGTGFGRTGTDSLKEALNKLGYRTYHMKEIIFQYMPDHFAKWKYLIDNDCKVADAGRIFDEIFSSRDYNAALGVTAFCAEMLLEHYPEAKFVHTERKSGEQWQASAAATVCSGPAKPVMRFVSPFVPLLRDLRIFVNTIVSKYLIGLDEVHQVSTEFCQERKEEMINMYNKHNRNIKSVVPSHRLLVINNHGRGWGPLCTFLGKPIPSEPFPHANSRAEFRKMLLGLAKRYALLVVVSFALLGAALYCIIPVVQAEISKVQKKTN